MAQLKPLPEHLQKVAIEELEEVPSRLPQDLQDLKLWIEKQSHLKARTTDQDLVQFLRGCKYSMQKAKDKIESFYTLKSTKPEFCSLKDIDSEKLMELRKQGYFLPLPNPVNNKDARLIWIRLNYSTKTYNVEDLFQFGLSLMDLLMISDPYACINGIIFGVDLAGFTANHALQFTPIALKTAITYLEKALPLRIRALHFINMPAVAEPICKLIMQLFSKKMRERITICGKNLENLEEYLPRQNWPEEYGGNNGSLDVVCPEYNKVWEMHREYFKENAQYGIDESLRTGKSIDFNDNFGCNGSFRKIEID